jgi:sortase A
MKDRRPVDELSIEELEEILRIRKAEARLERVRRRKGDIPPVDLLAPEPVTPVQKPLPDRHRQFQDEGATAGFRARSVDDEEEKHARQDRPRRRLNWAWVRDKALLVVEVAAVLGLILVLYETVSTLSEINEDAQQEMEAQLPTLTPVPPTPMIQPTVRGTPRPTLEDGYVLPVLLPSGHTPPDSPGGPQPEEVPAHLQGLVEPITPMPAPTPGPEHAVRIRVPSIDVDAPVVEGDDWESLKRGAGHYIGSANPGERGNCVISAHNDIYGEIFRDLPDVELGDIVEVFTASQVHRYVITQKRIIEPTEVSVLYPTSTPVLTLISCYPYGIDTHRIVVIAELQP